MTPRQALAFQFPCYRAVETTSARFAALHRVGAAEAVLSSIVTVNR